MPLHVAGRGTARDVGPAEGPNGPWPVHAPQRTVDVVTMFADRVDAGRRLAERLTHLAGRPLVVLGLPRGGVPVAFEVARALGAPLDVLLVRKLGVPFQPELAMGAIGEDGVRVLNDDVITAAGVDPDEVTAVDGRERVELDRRVAAYRGGRPRVPLDGRTAVVVDDGLATGATARAACRVAREHGASHVVLAVPVAPPACGAIDDADEVVWVATPEPFFAIGQFYEDFSQLSDADVTACLDRAAAPRPRDDDVSVQAGPLGLAGRLTVPAAPSGVVVFAHGSGSSRHSPRNRYAARVLNDAGIATLLFDLLSVDEEGDRANVFDVEMLGARLRDATRWVRIQPGFERLPVGYFGASTGAAAALWAAAAPDSDVAAIVSRGGRPDLAGPRLAAVRAPTLLIVGGHDPAVLALNEAARSRLRCRSRLAVVPGATHLFEEPGALEAAVAMARNWFVMTLGRDDRPDIPSELASR
jgi:putative phosphoribosyl transferase